MPQKQTSAQKWISDAAYFNSLNRESRPDQQTKDWLEAEQQYFQLLKSHVKSGLVRLD